MTDGYRARTTNTVVAETQRDPNAFRSAIGEGLEQVGRALGQTAEQQHDVQQRMATLEYQQQARQEQVGLSRELTTAHATMQQRLTEAALAPPDSVAGFSKTITDDWKKAADAILGRATTRDAQDSLTQQAAAIGGSLTIDAGQFEAKQNATRLRDDMTQHADMFESRAQDLGTGKEAQTALLYKELDAYKTGLASVAGGYIADRFDRDTRRAIQKGQAEGAIARGEFDFARGLIDGEDAKGWDPDTRMGLTHQLASAERSAAAAARAEQAASDREQKQQIATAQALLETGAGKPQDWFTLASQQEAAGDGDGAVRSRARGTADMAALQYRGETVPQMNTLIGQLDAKGARGGLTADEAAMRTGLIRERDVQAGLLSKPGGALLAFTRASNGTLAPIDMADPSSFQRRYQAAAKAAAWAGRGAVEPLVDTDLPMFRDAMRDGTGGQMRVLNALSGFRDAGAIDAAAKQVSGPGDSAFRIAARTLAYPAGRQLAEEVLRGDAIRKKAAPWPDGAEAHARRDFAGWYGGALAGGNLPVDLRNDLFQSSLAYYAARTNGGAYDAGKFADAIETMLGRSGAGGGVYRVQGKGIVIAPPTMKPNAMMARFARSTARDYFQAADQTYPVWSNGQGLKRGDINGLLPTMLADGRYGFRGSNNQLIHDNHGNPYSVDLARLPAR